MHRNAYVLVFDALADWEAAYALCAIARSEKHPIRTVGFSTQVVRTMGGLTVVPDLTLEQVDPADSAMLILPGGDAWEDPQFGLQGGLRTRLQDLHAHQVPIAAICGATLELARAGLTRHVRHTSNALEYLQAMVPSYRDADVYVNELAVSDQGVITASVTGSLEFARAIMKQLQLDDDAAIDDWYVMFKGGTIPS